MKRPLDSFVLDVYVGLTAGIVAEMLSGTRLDRGLSLLLLPLAVLTAAAFLRGAPPQRRVLTTALVGGFALVAPSLLLYRSSVPAHAALAFASTMLPGTALGLWARRLVSNRRYRAAIAATAIPLALSAVLVFGPGARVVDRLYHPLVNRTLPALALETFAGGPIDPAGWKGHVVVLDFWATWCGPCKQELPTLAALERQYRGDSRVIVLAADVSAGMGDTADKARAYLHEHEPELPGALWTGNADAFSTLRSTYGQQSGIPLLLIVDKNGRVRFIEEGFDAPHFHREVATTVDELLREGS